MSCYIFITLSSSGWGEASFALRIALDLQRRGDEVMFFVRPAVAPALKGAVPFKVVEGYGSIATLLIDDYIARKKPEAVILADYFTCAQFLENWDLTPDFLFEADAPLIAIDTWDTATTGFELDMFQSTIYRIPQWIGKIKRRILPVPFVSPNDGFGVCNALPASQMRAIGRRQVRYSMGISLQQKILLFCTAGWQYPAVVHPDGRRIAAAVPRLLLDYISRLDPSVHLVHIGPVELESWRALAPRYHWIPQITPSRFRAVLAVTDLMVSLNFSAATLLSAITAGIPTVIVSNTRCMSTFDEAIAEARTPYPERMHAWLNEVLPLYPFLLWPLGFHRFLSPLLHANPYKKVFEMIELLDEDGFVNACTDLLSSSAVRDEHLHRQISYIDIVKKLPSPNEVLDAFLKQ
jgi:hypothetical protein